MLKFMKRFDVHTKTIDGVSQQTVVGAVATIVALITVIFLVMTELSFYLEKDIVSRMQPDSVIGPQLVDFDFVIDFHSLPCDQISFSQEVTRGAMHQHIAPVVQKKALSGTSGCSVGALIVTDKVAGNVRVGVTGPVAPFSDDQIAAGEKSVNIAHTVRYIKFNPPKEKSAEDHFPDVKYPLVEAPATLVNAKTAIQHYAIQVVPTYYTDLAGTTTHINQYGFTEKIADKNSVSNGVILSGQFIKDFQGVLINYDFSPVVLINEERQESVFEFLATLCGIVGGFIVVLSLLERCVTSSAKAIIGKKD